VIEGKIMADEEKKVEETKTEEKVEEKKEEKAEPSGKFKDLIKKIEELSVLELAELVKELEERFGVSAAAPVAVAAAGAPAAGGAEAEEKSAYTIHLKDAGAQKIAVIKVIREIKPELGLKEAKDLVDAAPKDVKTDVPKKDAEEAKKKLEAAGAKVELK
jgi:large subunit ribosomal protein L7/L12